MIRHSKQDWTVGASVKVGFMTLTVESVRAVKDGMPDIYTLVGKAGKRYEFIPHHGLRAIE